MDLVVDANILFAALIKEGTTDELLFADHLHLYAPEFIFIEFEKHKEEILQKTKRTTEEFEQLIEILKRRIKLIPLDEFTTFIEKAEQISPDPNDVIYFALALKLHAPIWSNDKELKKQEVVKIYNTAEIIEF